MSWAEILPVIFMGLMGLAMFLYVVLDGFDLGVGQSDFVGLTNKL